MLRQVVDEALDFALAVSEILSQRGDRTFALEQLVAERVDRVRPRDHLILERALEAPRFANSCLEFGFHRTQLPLHDLAICDALLQRCNRTLSSFDQGQK